MDQLIIDYGTHLVTQSRSIHDFVILLGQNMGSRSCDKTRTVIYISAKKKVLITGENIGLLP